MILTSLLKLTVISNRGSSPAAPPPRWALGLHLLGPFSNPSMSLTLSGSLWTSMKAEYSSIRSLEEAMVRSCHTGTAVAVGAGGGAKGS